MTSDPFAELGVPWFRAAGGELWCEDLPVGGLADEFGTPLYVYSRAAVAARFARLRSAWGDDAEICYAVKANSNLAIIRLLATLGAGFDIVSHGELLRLRAAGVSSDRTVFAGVVKEAAEIDAAIDAGILFFNLESPHEVDLLDAAGGSRGRPVDVAIRLNPDVDPRTHRYISTGKRENKFGLDLSLAADVVAQIVARPNLRLVGYHVHLGSQLRSAEPYLAAFDRVEEFIDGAPERGESLRFYDLGGGYGIRYGDEGELFDVETLAQALRPRLRARGLTPVLEPGRFLVGDAGILLTRVRGEKPGGDLSFLLVDAAMNDLLRPALYGATHPILPVRISGRPVRSYDVVGPVCESSDFLGKARALPEVHRDELLAVFSAGAYGASMTSNYNSRRRPAEVLVDGGEAKLIRRRESWEDLWARET